jgi:hypothetical protein
VALGDAFQQLPEPSEVRARTLRAPGFGRQGHQTDELDPRGLRDLVGERLARLRRDPGSTAGEVHLDQHREPTAPFRGPTRETGERPSGREGLHHVGEIGDAVGRVALERPDEVPHCLGHGGALGAKLLHVVLTELAHAGLPGPANGLRRDRL